MKRVFHPSAFCALFYIVLLTGCAVKDVSQPAFADELPKDTTEPIDHYLDAYLPWQLEDARASGVSDEMLRKNVEQSVGSLENFMTSLNAPLPPQSANDEILLDTLLEKTSDSFMQLRSEMAVLLTEQKRETYYSYVAAATEYGQPFVVAWEWDGSDIRILDRRGDNFPHSAVVSPVVEEIAGERVMFGTLNNDVWYGDDARYPVHCGTFSVTMENGDRIVQDVSNLPCVMVFLPEDGECADWSLTDTDGELIWDSLGSMWRAGGDTANLRESAVEELAQRPTLFKKPTGVG
jgi:hypothetical protein